MKPLFMFLFQMIMLILLSHTTLALDIRLPITSNYQQRDSYQIALLELLLSKLPGPHNISVSQSTYSQSRIISALQDADADINLYWMGSSRELEATLQAIPIPIYRGLMGYRVFIIHKHKQALFDSVNGLKDLQNYLGAQGVGWSDNHILHEAGLNQYVTSYENIFRMINKGRHLDYFSRSIAEAYIEVESRSRQLPELRVEDKLLLVYPFAMFFFAARDNKKLANSLLQGFKIAYKDGSFLEFFYAHPSIRLMMAKADLQTRLKISIPNTLMTRETLEIDRKYWHEHNVEASNR